MEYLTALLLGVLGSLIAWEISLRYRKWCEAIIRSAAQRLPDEQRLIREEEWLAALNDCVGMVSAFSHAIGCWVGAPAVGASASLKRAVSAAKPSRALGGRFRVKVRIDPTAFMRAMTQLRRVLPAIWPVLASVIGTIVAKMTLSAPVMSAGRKLIELVAKLFG